MVPLLQFYICQYYQSCYDTDFPSTIVLMYTYTIPFDNSVEQSFARHSCFRRQSYVAVVLSMFPLSL